jgi:PIN domain nuclease of toxin-antitoxin system
MRLLLNTPVISVASLWELVIKQALGRHDFRVEPAVLRRALLDGGWQELSPLHRDPFDRLLLAWRPIRGRCG